ncbi:MAG: hypothetical protein KDK36_15510 [Leptospiraceae bacterium]|nr:hypothetical protein [Leptospiraceae bacterium]
MQTALLRILMVLVLLTGTFSISAGVINNSETKKFSTSSKSLNVNDKLTYGDDDDDDIDGDDD